MAEQGSLDRLPPHSRDAERSVLGSMLRDNAVIGDVVQILRDDNFYADAHQKIFKGITSLYDKGHPADLVTLADWLKEQKFIEDAGGYAYLAELWDASPTAANAEYYARIVRDKALVRGLIHAGTEILRDSYDQGMPADELLEAAERKILDIAQMGIVGQTATLQQALGEAFNRIDARSQNEGMSLSGLPTGFVDLDEKTAGFQNNELIIIGARPSTGKCLAFDAEIVLADGSVATMETIFQRRQASLLTLGADLRFHPTEPSAFVDDGVKPVYRVTTRLGRRIETTASHPFLTMSGWKPLAELSVGDTVAVPRRLDVFGQEVMREGEIKLLAYLIGDGCLTDSTPEFTNTNPRLQADFTLAVEEFGPLKVRRDNSRGTRAMTLHVAADSVPLARNRADFAVRLKALRKQSGRAVANLAQTLNVNSALVYFWEQGTCVPNEATFAGQCVALEVQPEVVAPTGRAAMSKNAKNPLTRWLVDLGLWGKGSKDKFVPPAVFRLQRAQVALFLNRLFATDGWASVSTHGTPQIGYATVSERLGRQVQHLLLRFGILAALRHRSVLYREERRAAWQLEITDQEALRTFVRDIGIFGKEDALAKVARALEGRNHQTNADLIPRVIWDRLAVAKGKASWAAVARQLGLGVGANLHCGKRALSRRRLMQFATLLQDNELQQLASSEVYWDGIVSIDAVGWKQVYDLTIPTTHNFVANDICVHNTAFALGITRHMAVEEKIPVFFVSLEQSRIELAERLLCSHARVDSHKLRKGHLSSEDLQKLFEAGDQLSRAQLFIDDSPGQGMLRIAANARRLKLRHGIRIVFIDYLQLIEPDNRRDSRQEQVAQISRRLKFLARELQIPVVALAQVNRSSEDRQDHRPRLADLRESGSIEQDADTVMMLHRPEMHEPGQHEGVIEVIVAKQRNGPTGDITLTYLKQFMRFENFAVEAPFGYGGQ